jgi:hypothetical protein
MTARFPATTPTSELLSAAHAHSLTPLAQLRPQPSTLTLSLALRASARGTPPKDRRHYMAVVARLSRLLPW